ncbi:jg1012 [Pararge aegeria aegeria]|uniref:Jg1012 protein n=1 Tax=Pararge aegeria aegeria TaxID=348720 RepID=A0A8S4SLK4_9NEOP|nr:jg1012 [Pararge aegeria aegeria]
MRLNALQKKLPFTLGVQFIPERVKVVYTNPKYFHNYTYSVKRYGRKSGYYINIESTLKQEWNNNVTLHLIFNQYLHNEYRRSFIELHYKFCDLLKDEKFFAPRIIQYGIKCPLPIGTYRFMNLSISLEEFPSVFPYERARIDVVYATTNTSEIIYPPSCPPGYPPACLPSHLATRLRARLPGYPSASPPAWPPDCPPGNLPACPPGYTPGYPPACPSGNPPACPPGRLPDHLIARMTTRMPARLATYLPA